MTQLKTLSPTGALAALVMACSAIPAIAQDTGGGAANAELGASYSSLRGPLAFVGLNAENLMGSGLDVALGYQAGESGEAINARLRKTFPLGDTAFGADTRLAVSVDAYRSDWDFQDYAADHIGADVTLAAQTPGGLRYSTRVFWQQDSLSDLSDTISPLVTPLEDSTAIGVGASLGYSTFAGRGPLETGFDIGATVTLATPAGDREWLATELSGQYNTPLSHGLILAISGEAGQISGRGDTDVGIIDRAFLGNPAPRGFSFAGLGPRDLTDTVDTALGGNRYLTSSVEVRVPTPNPDLTVAAFADAGALWQLDTTAGGASGDIDDSYALRTSVGVSVYWDSAFGLVQLNVAKPIDIEDGDQEEQVSLNLNFRF